MRKDTLYITLSRDITSYTITSGQRAIATNVNYAVTIESPTLTTNLAGRDVSVIISDTEGNTLTTATTFYPDTNNPYKAVTGSLLLDGAVYAKFFDGKPVDTAVRLPIVIRDKSATLLSSDIVVTNGGENAEPSASDEVVAGLVNAIRFYDLAEFKAWLDGTKERPDGIKPTDIVVGQWVHTQQDGSFICKELIGAEPSVTKNFTTIVTQFPLTGTLKMNPDNGVGLSVYSGDVYNDDEATSYSVDAITYKGDAFTFTAGDNQVARQKDNYALENRVNSTMTATLNAVKADNANTYQAMLPVMNTTIEARDRAETAAQGAKSSETRAVEAETRAATSEANALAYKNSAAASEENAGLYRQQALASAQKAEQEAVTATTKASEAAGSASKAAASANEALYYKNSAETFSDSAESWSHSASEYAAAADTSADLAKMSEDNATSSAANAATSESNAMSYKNTAVASADLSTTNKNSAADFSASASASASAAASSATAAANSAAAAAQSAQEAAQDAAQDAAEGVTALLQGKVDAAEAAKAGAEAAKTAAETAKTGAEAAKTAATSSATAAANSASAAAKSATDLAEAVATAEGLDGRITLIEQGKGIVKKADGSVEVYTRLPFGDGTLKVVKDVTNAKMVVPYERDSSEVYACYGDGVYAYIYCSGKFMAAYDKDCNRVAAAMTGKGYAFTLYNHCAIFDGEYWFICSGKYLYKVSASGELVKGVLVESEVYGTLYPVLNPKTGHLVILNPASAIWNVKDTTAYSNILVYDKNLNAVLNDDGSRREYRYPRETCFPLGYTDKTSGLTSDGTGLGFYNEDAPDVFITVNTCFFIFVRSDVRGNNIIFYGDGVSLNKLGDADELIQVREAIPRVDENGYTVYKKDEAGNYILKKNYPSNGKGVIIPETDEGEIIRGYLAVQDRESMGKAGAFRWHPKIERRPQNTQGYGTYYAMTDGVDRYWITPDDQIIDLYRLNDSAWSSRQTPLDSSGNLFLKAQGKLERASGFTTKYTIPFLVGLPSWNWGFNIGNELLCYETLGTNALSRFFCAKSNFNVDSAITCDTNDRIPFTIKISHNRFNAEPDNATWAMMSSPVWIVTRDWVMGGILS